jgi:hypothetical protein
VVVCEDEEQAKAIGEERKTGPADIYVDVSVHNGRAGIDIYVLPCKARISKTVAGVNQADAQLTELLAINEAANWL